MKALKMSSVNYDVSVHIHKVIENGWLGRKSKIA